PSPDPTRTYEMKDFDVLFYNPELALASFVGEFHRKNGDADTLQVRYRITDVYAKRQGKWIQVASHTVVDPAWRAETSSQPTAIGPRMRDQILAAREKVWKAYFENDRAALEKSIPALNSFQIKRVCWRVPSNLPIAAPNWSSLNFHGPRCRSMAILF